MAGKGQRRQRIVGEQACDEHPQPARRCEYFIGDGRHVACALHDAVACDQKIATPEEGVELVVGSDGRCGVVGGAGVDVAAAGQNHLPVGCGGQADVDLRPVGTVVPQVAEFDPTTALVVAEGR